MTTVVVTWISHQSAKSCKFVCQERLTTTGVVFVTTTVVGTFVETSFLLQVLSDCPEIVMTVVLITGLVVWPTLVVQTVLTLQVDLDVVEEVVLVVP